MTCGIYQILNLRNNKRYIGSSKNIYKRLWDHKKKLESNKHHNKHLQSSYNKDGLACFEFKTILECRLEDRLFYEDLIISGYKTNNPEFGYNFRLAADSNKGLPVKYKSGDKFNRITLLNLSDRIGYWWAECDCGTVWEVQPNPVKTGKVKSCGCYNRELASALMQKQHNDPEWSRNHSQRSKNTMTITMSRSENKQKAREHIIKINKERYNG